jgi:hypothetical protein
MRKTDRKSARDREREGELTNDINECSARYDFSSTSAKEKKKKEKRKERKDAICICIFSFSIYQ